MYYQQTANEIIRLLTLCPNEAPEADAVIEKCHAWDDWYRMLICCYKKRQEAAQESLSETEMWQANLDMCIGSFYYSRDRVPKAVEHYQSTLRNFGHQNMYYCHAVALMALGRAHQSLDNHDEALRFFNQSSEMACELSQNCINADGRCKVRACRDLCRALKSMIAEAKEARGLHFIPQPVTEKVMAGQPLYMPGEGSQYPTEHEQMVWEDKKYRFLSLETREPSKKTFRPSHQYCCVSVEGDSMVHAGIHPGDTLLVRCQDSAPQNGQIAVFFEEDLGPMVKRFYRSGDRVYLESANPDYRTRVYDSESPKLKTVGIVEVILEEIE